MRQLLDFARHNLADKRSKPNAKENLT